VVKAVVKVVVKAVVREGVSETELERGGRTVRSEVRIVWMGGIILRGDTIDDLTMLCDYSTLVFLNRIPLYQFFLHFVFMLLVSGFLNVCTCRRVLINFGSLLRVKIQS
jgi:hypothetical protein